MEVLMRQLLAIGLLFFASDAISQTVCFDYGRTISCDGANGQNRTITRFNDNAGVVTNERGQVEPYTILPRHDDTRYGQTRHDDEQYGARSRHYDRDDRRRDTGLSLGLWDR